MTDGVKLEATGFLGFILTESHPTFSAPNVSPFRQKSSRMRGTCGSALPAD